MLRALKRDIKRDVIQAASPTLPGATTRTHPPFDRVRLLKHKLFVVAVLHGIRQDLDDRHSSRFNDLHTFTCECCFVLKTEQAGIRLSSFSAW